MSKFRWKNDYRVCLWYCVYMNEKAWWQKTFGNQYLEIYEGITNPSRTHTEVNFLWNKLNLAPNMKVLDVACGYGRHSLALAQLGCDVTGIDQSSYLLKVARENAKLAGVKVSFLKRDIRSFHLRKRFDVALSLFTSFGYFEEADNLKVLKNVYASLKKRGIFVLDINNLFYLLQSPPTKGIKYSIDPITLRWKLERQTDKGNKIKADIQLYTLPDIKRVLESNNFKITGVFGSFSGTAYAISSKRLIILAQKKG